MNEQPGLSPVDTQDDAAGAAPAPTPIATGDAALTYEQASARLEEIIRRLDSGSAGLRETLDLVREGRTLVERCAAELEEVGRGLRELRLEDLVTRLEESAG
jgi:exodeoxyribonuclease VII small subunit